jgi:uncharacterized protein YbdZ (MbtH family)
MGPFSSFPTSKDASLLKPRGEPAACVGPAVRRLRAGGHILRAAGVLAAVLLAAVSARAREEEGPRAAPKGYPARPLNPAGDEVELRASNLAEPILISAEAANRWSQGVYEVWLLRGNCQIVQGADRAFSQEAVLWIDRGAGLPRPGGEAGSRSKVIAYLEGHVVLEFHRHGAAAQASDWSWLGRFVTGRSVEVRAAVVAGRPDVLPASYQRAMELRNPASSDAIQQTAAVAPLDPTAKPRRDPLTGQPISTIGPPLPPGTRRLRVFPRGDVPMQVDWFAAPDGRGRVAVIEQGVTLIVDTPSRYGTIDVATDRMVLWTTGPAEPDLTGQAPQDEHLPLEIYMEGNVVFREATRVIHAEKMYYDMTRHVGTLLGADILMPVRRYEGLVRLHAEIIQQLDHDHFAAQNAFLTSSRLGAPAYRLQSGSLFFEDQPVIDPATGRQAVDPVTGNPQHDALATARDNVFYLGDVPVFYWPVLTKDLNDPSFFLRRIGYKSDGVFGQQILTDWNVYDLLGMRHPPVGTEWDLTLDYMSQRGFGFGSTFLYRREDFFGIPGRTAGLADSFAIIDHGYDNLGIDRPHVTFNDDFRYRLLWQHREQLPNGFQVTAELGAISDRNFLPEYFNHEWTDLKDQTTDLELRRTQGNVTWNLFGQVRLDDFFTQTQWLPRFDHFWLGQSLLADRLTWFEHSSLGYADFRTCSLPNPAQGDVAVSHLPWEPANFHGGRLLTRHEFDWPIEVQGMKIIPYFLGELGYWGEDLDRQAVNRAYYQAGIRADLPLWSVDPTVESSLWNLHGLAHKIDFQAEFWQSGSNVRMTTLPLYDPLDDNEIQDFRRRAVVETFGFPAVAPPGFAPPPPPRFFDERLYALRSDMGGWVTAPSMEIADDLTALRLAVDQRWQTKRGPSDDRHIIDWIVLDSEVTFFPDPSRDNFGSVAGLWDYEFRWNVGDRLTLVSEGLFDFFPQGQKIVSVGAILTRPPRGAIYAGFRMVDGPVKDDAISFSYNYWMSPKWISIASTSIDLTDTKNVGLSLRLIRVGESLLVSGNFSVDPIHNTYGYGLAIEPRFLPKGRLSQIPGAHIPPAGAYGLE